jgi:type IV secretory pathway TraG/TraD family ATPase VirD4
MNFTRRDEALAAMMLQYTRVPADGSRFQGHPGFPVAFQANDNEPGKALQKLMSTQLSDKAAQRVIATAAQTGAGQYFIDQSQTNNIVSGPTRSGKGQQYIDPFINIVARASASDSVVIHDPKGDLYKTHAATMVNNGYRVLRFALNGEKSDGFNPLAPIFEAIKAESGDDLSLATASVARLLSPFEDHKDPYWTNAGRQLVMDLLVLYVFDAVFEVTQGNELVMNETIQPFGDFLRFMMTQLNEWSQLISGEESDMIFNQEYYLGRVLGEYDKDRTSFILSNLDAAENDFRLVAGQAERTYSSIVSVLMATASKVNTSLTRSVTGTNDIDIERILIEKTAVFVTPNLKSKAYNGLMASFIELTYNAWVNAATTGQLGDKRLFFILDEFGSMTAIDNLPEKMTFSAGLNVSFTLAIQSIEQLHDKYGTAAGTILGNANNFAYVGNSSPATLRYVSEQLTDARMQVDAQNGGGEVLLKALQLTALRKHESIVLRRIMPGNSLDVTGRPSPIFHVLHGALGDGLQMPYFSQFHMGAEQLVLPSEPAADEVKSLVFFNKAMQAGRGQTLPDPYSYTDDLEAYLANF